MRDRSGFHFSGRGTWAKVAQPMTPEFRFTTAATPCPYLPTETSQLMYRLLREIGGAQYAALLNRGWRRFGYQYFRPRCPQCARCRSLRVRVAEFAPNKAQRRAWARNQDLRLAVRPASATAEHVRLFNEYHAYMETRKGWRPQELRVEDYARYFVGFRPAFAFDFLYYLEETLVAVGLVDVTAEASSSAYFYHAPALRPRALGVYSMLKELEFARARAIPYHHLGYWVKENASMAYKGTFRPAELLVGYPGDYEEPRWVEEAGWAAVLNDEEPGLIL